MSRFNPLDWVRSIRAEFDEMEKRVSKIEHAMEYYVEHAFGDSEKKENNEAKESTGTSGEVPHNGD